MTADSNGVAFVAAQIVARYANPSRAAHLYLFQVMPTADLATFPPPEKTTIRAWLDEDHGLAESAVGEVIARCAETIDSFKERTAAPQTKLSAHDRRRLMARGVLFSVRASEESIIVELFSRSLAFAPRGDRRVTETWRRSGEGAWYSAAIGRE